MEIKDSGERRKFGTGAVRDCAEGKGRCDLLPFWEVGDILDDDYFRNIDSYIYNGEGEFILDALHDFVLEHYGNWETALLEVAKQYEGGAKKYGDRNFEKGIPLHCYIDSATRHYLKFKRGDRDEPHDNAIVWNLLNALWTQRNHPDLCDLPFADKIAQRAIKGFTYEE